MVSDLLQPCSLPLWHCGSRRSGAARGVSTARGRWQTRPALTGARRNSTPELDPMVVSADEPPTPRRGRRSWADMLYPAAYSLGIARQFGPGPDPRSREQQANLLCDDDAELLVILGVEVDAVGVA